MFPESLEDTLSSFMMEGYIILGVNSHVIHIDFKPFFWMHICEDMVHKSLEGGGSVAKSKEHDSRFEESHGGDESGFSLILLPDVNVVISPTNVKFGEQGGLLHVINEFRNEGEWISIPDSVGVQVAVILAWAKSSILLGYKEEGGGLGGLRRYNLLQSTSTGDDTPVFSLKLLMIHQTPYLILHQLSISLCFQPW